MRQQLRSGFGARTYAHTRDCATPLCALGRAVELSSQRRMPWNPSAYLAFASERLRPALDLLARVPLERAARVADLGCGAGNVTRLLVERFPSAELTGVDSSPEMLARAKSALPGVRFVEADIASWQPDAPLDLIFSNAALHWLPEHARLFPRLCAWLAPGGCLAVQMPGSFQMPSHTAAREAALDGPWRGCLKPGEEHAGVCELRDYHAWLRPLVRSLDLWETTYLHVLEGDDPVTEWFSSTLLVPYLEALSEEHRAGFLAAYRRRVKAAYPRQGDGRTLMPMRRLFIVAER